MTALAWSANGATLASGSADATVRLWPVDPSGAARTPTVLREDSAVTALCWSPEDPNVLATATNDKTIRFWDVRSKRAEQTVSLPRTDSVLYLAWSHDGAVLAAGTKDDTLLLLDARRSTVDARKAAIGGATIQPFEMNELAWTPDGLLFISAGPKTVVDTYEGIINVVLPKEDLSGVTPVVSLQAHTGQIQSLRFDPAGRHFATGSTDSTINYWSVEDLAVIRCFDRLEFAAKSLSFSFDGAYLATASDDKIVDIVGSAAVVVVVLLGIAPQRFYYVCYSWDFVVTLCMPGSSKKVISTSLFFFPYNLSSSRSPIQFVIPSSSCYLSPSSADSRVGRQPRACDSVLRRDEPRRLDACSVPRARVRRGRFEGARRRQGGDSGDGRGVVAALSAGWNMCQ